MALRWLFLPLAAVWLTAGSTLLDQAIVKADGDRSSPLTVEEVAEGVYALIGPTGPRTADNHALNANFGFVVTDAGVAVIDSGASPAGAAIIHDAVRQMTDLPVRWVLNTGSQDHRWLGNGYFAERGASIHALQATVATQRHFTARHIERLKAVLAEGEVDAIEPAYAAEPAAGERQRLQLGGRTLELRRFADAHFPGDAVVWLPGTEVLFSGDHIYVDRMLGIHPFSEVQAWHRAFQAAMELGPQRIVPGHGGVCGPAEARAHTGSYLDWLLAEVGQAVEDWEPLGEVTQRLTRQAPQRFKQLRHFEAWHPTNINRTYTQLETMP